MENNEKKTYIVAVINIICVDEQQKNSLKHNTNWLNEKVKKHLDDWIHGKGYFTSILDSFNGEKKENHINNLDEENAKTPYFHIDIIKDVHLVLFCEYEESHFMKSMGKMSSILSCLQVDALKEKNLLLKGGLVRNEFLENYETLPTNVLNEALSLNNMSVYPRIVISLDLAKDYFANDIIPFFHIDFDGMYYINYLDTMMLIAKDYMVYLSKVKTHNAEETKDVPIEFETSSSLVKSRNSYEDLLNVKDDIEQLYLNCFTKNKTEHQQDSFYENYCSISWLISNFNNTLESVTDNPKISKHVLKNRIGAHIKYVYGEHHLTSWQLGLIKFQ